MAQISTRDSNALVVGLIATLSLAACGHGPSESSPTAPSMVTLSGTLTSTNGGAALNASMDFGTVQTTAVNGQYSVTVPAGMNTLALTISGFGLVQRRTYVAPGLRTVNFDAIADGGSFDLTFYRQLVRNTFDVPGTLEPLRRWNRSPRIFIATADNTGASIDARTLDVTEATIVTAVQAWTGGLYTPVTTREGGTREGESGWISVRWTHGLIAGTTPQTTYCGLADVAKDGGMVNLSYGGLGCRCSGGPEIGPNIVRHEVGHALGFWHTGNNTDVMFPSYASGCSTDLSAREKYHASIAYKRPAGNIDPDTDPITTVNVTPRRIH